VNPHRRLRGDAGETLVETLMSIVIMGLVATAIIGGLFMSVRASDYHRREATAESLIRAAAEQVKGATYASCAGTGSYTLPTPPAGYASQVLSVEYWTGLGTPPNTFQSTCPTAGDQGLQRITLRMAATSGRDTETLALLKRKS